MAEYKVINTAQLDADLMSIAEAIRTKGDTSDVLIFPQGFVDAVENITVENRDETISLFVNGDTEWTSLTLNCPKILFEIFKGIKVRNLSLTECEIISEGLFFENIYIENVRLCKANLIKRNAFCCASNLKKLIIETPLDNIDSDSVPPCTLEDITAFSASLIESWGEGCGVYVPEELVPLYEADSNWCMYPIKAIPNRDTDPDGYNSLYGCFEEVSQ